MRMLSTSERTPEFKALPFAVSFADYNDGLNWAIRRIKEAGYKVVAAESAIEARLETPGRFIARLGISWMTYRRRVMDPACPPFIRFTGPTGRIGSLISNPALEAWMARRQ